MKSRGILIKVSILTIGLISSATFSTATSSIKNKNFITETMSAFGQFAATSQFYLYGRKHCTKTGYQEHVKSYEKPDILEDKNLSLVGKKYMITGANAGIGFEMTKFLASKGASVYMVCRNPERANKARDEIVAETGNADVKVLLCDCSLEADIRRMWSEYCNLVTTPQLDGLVCNAGLLANEKTLTSEGVEITLAVHLLFGTYLLGQLAMPYLEATEGSRVIAVSSGGMYNTKFPVWDVASSTGKTKYDGQFSYAYAKRGQVLLMEQWKNLHPKVKFVSAHPGWTQTEAVDAAYGANKSYLEPLRNTWEGAEGIIWLIVEAADKIEGGAFYLDRKPCVKHMAGAFSSEGTFTKNSEAEVQEMMRALEAWSSVQTRPSAKEIARRLAVSLPLVESPQPVDIPDFMGDWFVLANIPTPLEVGTSNNIEHYDYDEQNKRVQVTFTYVPGGTPTAKPAQAFMRGYIKNAPLNTRWSLDVKIGFYWPLGLTYLIPYICNDYVIVSVPDRSYLWIMTRGRPLPPNTTMPDEATAKGVTYLSQEEQDRVYQLAFAKAIELGFNADKIVRVPWTSL